MVNRTGTYFDSSALIAIYITERFSVAARACSRTVRHIPFTLLHELEVPNAFERLVGREAITREQCRTVQAHLQEDIDSQRIVRLSLDADAVFSSAGELTRTYAAKFLARSLDLLHVAAAHAAKSTEFVSADDRQLAVARATGLDVIDIKRGV